MKKRKIRVLAALVLALAFSACKKENVGDEEIPVDHTEPFLEETARSISVFYPEENSGIIDDYSDNETIKKVEEKYGVSFSFYHGTWGEEEKAVEKMFSSGGYCDLMYMSHGLSYKGGDEAAVNAGVYRDLTDMVETNMPNYYALIQSDERLLHAAYNDDGKIVGLLIIPYDVQNQMVDDQSAMGGMIVRKDWLDEAGLDLPVTYEDWEKMLTVFRDHYGCKQPLYIAGGGYSEFSPGFSAGFGAIPAMQMNGEFVEFGPAAPGWKDYVTLMHKWYENGLIGSEYVVNDSYGIDEQSCITGETGAMLCVYHKVAGIESSIPGTADFCAVQYPVQKEGQVSQAKDRTNVPGERKIYVTTAVSDDELPFILALLDDFYDPETAMKLTYGCEGDTYTYDTYGKLEFSDKLLNHPVGYTFLEAAELYLLPSNLMALKDVKREMLVMSEEDRQMCEIWNKDGEALYVPPVTLTPKEQELYDRIMLDIKPYVKKMTNEMIVGAVDIESEWDNYIKTLYDMELEKAVKCYQDAYNRYKHRGNSE